MVYLCVLLCGVVINVLICLVLFVWFCDMFGDAWIVVRLMLCVSVLCFAYDACDCLRLIVG